LRLARNDGVNASTSSPSFSSWRLSSLFSWRPSWPFFADFLAAFFAFFFFEATFFTAFLTAFFAFFAAFLTFLTTVVAASLVAAGTPLTASVTCSTTGVSSSMLIPQRFYDRNNDNGICKCVKPRTSRAQFARTREQGVECVRVPHRDR